MEERKDQKLKKVDIQKMIEIQVKKDAKSPNDKNKSKFKVLFTNSTNSILIHYSMFSQVSDIIH